MKKENVLLFLLLIVLSCTTSVFAVDHIHCSRTSQGITNTVEIGNTYTNSYTCTNDYPASFPAVALTPVIQGKSGSTTGVSFVSSCASRRGVICNFQLTYSPSQAGLDIFNANINIGGNPSQYFLNVDKISAKVITTSNVINWPGLNSGQATVSLTGSGSGTFVADATDTAGLPITYTFTLSGSGSATSGSSGSFTLSGTTYNTTVIITANASGATPVSSPPIPLVLNKEFWIYNDSDEIIYPVIETPQITAPSKDNWLLAYFQDTNPAYTYLHNVNYRTYVNPLNGIAPGQSVKIVVPIYTQLTTTPNPVLPDQYIDWWQGIRVFFFDDHTALLSEYNSDTPVQTFSEKLFCTQGTCEPLTVRERNGIIGLNEPYQLAEYTFADAIGTTLPIQFAPNFVDYDISYVDHIYLPIGLGPINSNLTGYIGSIMGVNGPGEFRSILNTFLTQLFLPASTPWPKFTGSIQPRLPGAYNVTILPSPPLDANAPNVFQYFKNYWNACITSDCLNVKDLFDKNAANYSSVCGVPAPVSGSDEYIQHVYGWAAFACTGQTNALTATPGANYVLAESSYQTLQKQAETTPLASSFNPYVGLVHGSAYLNILNAYAYSIDDTNGNLHVPGDGVIMTIGGSNGLENTNPYNSSTAFFNVGLGAPTPPQGAWIAYGICTATPNVQLNGALSFMVSNINPPFPTPCEISLIDANNNLYHFNLTAAPPFPGPFPNNTVIQCDPGNTWCNGVSVGAAQAISTPPPTA